MSKTFTDRPQGERDAALLRMNISGPTMGTRFCAVFYAPPCQDTKLLAKQLQAGLDAVDGQMSTYRPHSVLMQFNQWPVGKWMSVPPQIFAVLERAQAIGKESGGAFDIGVGEEVAAAGFGAQAVMSVEPRSTQSCQPRPHAHLALELDAVRQRVRKHVAMALDLSGIAKGYGVDVMAQILEAAGIARYLVSIDGEVRAGQPKPGQQPFVVAIEAPLIGERAPARLMALERISAASSGDYRHWIERAGRRYSHTIDPRTGFPVAHNLASVTVLADTAMDADAWASALMVLGPDEGPDFARRIGLEALFMMRLANGRIDEIACGCGWLGAQGAA